MNFNMFNPAIAEHHQARDLAIRKLIDMAKDDYDITDKSLIHSVLASYGLLDDGFESEEESIIQEVIRRIR